MSEELAWALTVAFLLPIIIPLFGLLMFHMVKTRRMRRP